MANPEHVRVVKRGAAAITKWRGEHSEVRLDLRDASLSGADLTGADLFGANLTGAHLTGAHLFGANLTGADLFGANLTGASLRGANLTGADLGGANLTEANLGGANLFGADLGGANLSEANLGGANLFGADLSKARLHFTSVVNCDLSEVKGLETVVHEGPSSIGIDTIIMSGGKIPRAFLEGAGVPAIWIEYIPSLVTSPFEFYSAFLAHSHKDEEFVEKLYGNLKAKDVRVWYFPADARGGRRVGGEIFQAIRLYDKVMVVCSRDSLASPKVQEEVDEAVQKQQEAPERWTLLPIAIDNAVYEDKGEFASRLRRHVIEDFRGWREPREYAKALGKLLRDLNTRERPGTPARGSTLRPRSGRAGSP